MVMVIEVTYKKNSHGYGRPNAKLQLGVYVILGQVVRRLSPILKFVPRGPSGNQRSMRKLVMFIILMAALSSSSLILTFAVSHLR